MTTQHPSRNTAGTGKHAGYVADGHGGWITPAQYAEQERELDRQIKEWRESPQGAPLKEKPKP